MTRACRVAILRLVGGVLLASLLSVPGAPASHDPPKENPDSARRTALATSCGDKVVHLKSGQARQPVTVTEDELNAYMEVHRERLFESALKSVQVDLRQDTFKIRGVVNLGEAKIKLESLIQKAFRWIMSGNHRFDADVHFKSASGEGTYTVRSLSIDGIALPAFMIEFLASEAGQRQKPPMLPGKPFPMPYGLERATVRDRKATCYPAKQPTPPLQSAPAPAH